MSFKVGDIVTLSNRVRCYSWFSSYQYLWGMELLIVKIEKGLTIREKIIHFHDPRYGIRKWRESSFNHAVLTLENE